MSLLRWASLRTEAGATAFFESESFSGVIAASALIARTGCQEQERSGDQDLRGRASEPACKTGARRKGRSIVHVSAVGSGALKDNLAPVTSNSHQQQRPECGSGSPAGLAGATSLRQWLDARPVVGMHMGPIAWNPHFENALALGLVTRIVHQQGNGWLPQFSELIENTRRPCVRALCEAVRKHVRCPLVKSIFDPLVFSSTRALPGKLLRWMENVDKIVVPESPSLGSSLLGALHQCFSRYDTSPKGGAAAHRYRADTRQLAYGVYYTPEPLADYLAQRTLRLARESLLHGHASSLRILDPSCGCAGLLVPAFNELKQWSAHVVSDWSQSGLGGAGASRCPLAGALALASSALFGIDIDPIAVYYARLSILLPVWQSYPRCGRRCDLRRAR